LDRTIEIGQSGQYGLADQPGQISLDRSAGAGRPEHDRKDRRSGTAQLGQDTYGKIARIGQPVQDSGTGAGTGSRRLVGMTVLRQDGHNMRVRT
jgi:hypothetical protein